nr:hypothetical protein BaRGS_013670 [Batillaria attramentaria]
MGISVLADVKIYVYFEDLRTRVTETVQAQPYEWVELMADIGGVASLWLGLSVLGVLEIVHMLKGMDKFDNEMLYLWWCLCLTGDLDLERL